MLSGGSLEGASVKLDVMEIEQKPTSDQELNAFYE
jgi:hypothetical protein